MTDYRSVERLEVCCGDQPAGTLTRTTRGCEFRYSDAYLASTEPPIALHLPKTAEPSVTEGILNLHPFFAGLLPEGIMFEAARIRVGTAKDDLFAILAATGAQTIGDVVARIPGQPESNERPLDLAAARSQIAEILRHSTSDIKRIAAISGVVPKMSIGGIVRAGRNERYIVKLPPPEFPGLAENEAACMTLARRCGLIAPSCRVEDGDYLIERFDIAPEGKRLHVEDMCQAMNLYPHRKYAVDFAEIAGTMQRIGVSPAGLLSAIKLFAFSYFIGNGNLHAKNLSLIRRVNGQWVPSPVYDIVSTLPYRDQLPGAEVMALALADESFGRFDLAEFTDFGTRFGVHPKAVMRSVTTIAQSVLRHGPRILAPALPEAAVSEIIRRAGTLARD